MQFKICAGRPQGGRRRGKDDSEDDAPAAPKAKVQAKPSKKVWPQPHSRAMLGSEDLQISFQVHIWRTVASGEGA